MSYLFSSECWMEFSAGGTGREGNVLVMKLLEVLHFLLWFWTGTHHMTWCIWNRFWVIRIINSPKLFEFVAVRVNFTSTPSVASNDQETLRNHTPSTVSVTFLGGDGGPIGAEITCVQEDSLLSLGIISYSISVDLSAPVLVQVRVWYSSIACKEPGCWNTIIGVAMQLLPHVHNTIYIATESCQLIWCKDMIGQKHSAF